MLFKQLKQLNISLEHSVQAAHRYILEWEKVFCIAVVKTADLSFEGGLMYCMRSKQGAVLTEI